MCNIMYIPAQEMRGKVKPDECPGPASQPADADTNPHSAVIEAW